MFQKVPEPFLPWFMKLYPIGMAILTFLGTQDLAALESSLEERLEAGCSS